jgi:hypothetical protein
LTTGSLLKKVGAVADDREQKLVERVQRLRAEKTRLVDAHDRAARKRRKMKDQNAAAVSAGEPKPTEIDVLAAQTRKVGDLAKRANEIDTTLVAAEAELERFRTQKLGPKQRLAHKILESPNSRFLFSSPTGGTARGGFEAIAAGRKAPVAATGGTTDVSENLLRGVAAMVDAGVVLINCLTNGKHVTNSNHYRGKAVDLDLTSPLGARAIEAIAIQHNGRRNFEADHIHIDFV